jgi:hypothetical protein
MRSPFDQRASFLAMMWLAVAVGALRVLAIR